MSWPLKIFLSFPVPDQGNVYLLVQVMAYALQNSQFNEIVKASYHTWKNLGSEANQNNKSLYTSDYLLILLPANSWLLCSRPLKAFSVLDNPFPQVQYAFGLDNNDRFNLQSTSQENVSLPDPRDS